MSPGNRSGNISYKAKLKGEAEDSGKTVAATSTALSGLSGCKMRLRISLKTENGSLQVPIQYNHLVQGLIYHNLD